MRNEQSYLYKPLQKTKDLIDSARNLPSKKINPDPDTWGCLFDSGSSREHMLRECGLATSQPPANSKLAPLYLVARPAVYFTPKAEEAFLRQIVKIVRGIGGPGWTRNWRAKTKTLQIPTAFQRALVKLVPKREISVLLSSKDAGSGRYYKMILEDAPDQDFAKVTLPYTY
jgi:hypothetical protein